MGDFLDCISDRPKEAQRDSAVTKSTARSPPFNALNGKHGLRLRQTFLITLCLPLCSMFCMFMWPYSPLCLAGKTLGLLQTNPHHYADTSKVLVPCDTHTQQCKTHKCIIAGMVVYQHTHVPHTPNVFVYVSVRGCVAMWRCVCLCLRSH